MKTTKIGTSRNLSHPQYTEAMTAKLVTTDSSDPSACLASVSEDLSDIGHFRHKKRQSDIHHIPRLTKMSSKTHYEEET